MTRCLGVDAARFRSDNKHTHTHILCQRMYLSVRLPYVSLYLCVVGPLRHDAWCHFIHVFSTWTTCSQIFDKLVKNRQGIKKKFIIWEPWMSVKDFLLIYRCWDNSLNSGMFYVHLGTMRGPVWLNMSNYYYSKSYPLKFVTVVRTVWSLAAVECLTSRCSFGTLMLVLSLSCRCAL